jgi:hypothetical protein
MGAIPCESCRQRMNDEAVVCPHCGARRQSTGLAGKLSQDEIRALLATDPALRGAPPAGLIHTYMLPHPETRGGARVAEAVLTLATLPMVIVGLASFGIFVRKKPSPDAAPRGELGPVIAMTFMGGLGLWSALDMVGVAGVPMLAMLGGSLAALWARGAIRWRSATARSRELARVERLPEARALTAPPVKAPEPPAIASGAGEAGARAPEPAPPPADQPRMLR